MWAFRPVCSHSLGFMMKPLFLAFATLVILGQARAAPCNKMAALEVQAMLSEFAKSHIEGDHLAVYWTYKIDRQPEAKRLEMVKTYAEMDACLMGAAREIHFYRKTRIMGIASPTSGVRLIK